METGQTYAKSPQSKRANQEQLAEKIGTSTPWIGHIETGRAVPNTNYIQQLPKGQAGRLRGGENENPLTIRHRLITAAKAMNIPLIIKRSGNDIYFWREDGAEEQPRVKRRYTRRARTDEETTELDQAFTAVE